MVQTDEERKAKQREYYRKNREYLKKQAKKNYLKNHEKNIKYRRNWYQKNREQELERRKDYHETHKERMNKRSREYYETNKKNIKKKNKEYRIKNADVLKPKKRKRAKELQQEQKLQVFKHYSNGKVECACCHENNIGFLSLDHIHGGGGKHRKSINSNTYKWIINHDFPPGYQILCMNCNWGRRINGTCPHQM
tara:strand:+ start:81 stop:662 length:582 start_codon:yes stop_codon:yes gene_type:complete